MFHVALYEPEIPPNTGNIIRLCANTGAMLHLIHPLGFTLDEKPLRRAGLDYRDLTRVTEHPSLAAFLDAMAGKRLFACTTRAQRHYSDTAFEAGDVLLFGPESRGLPADYLATLAETNKLRIPMRTTTRSLNLSNAVAIILYEAWRQQGFSSQ